MANKAPRSESSFVMKLSKMLNEGAGAANEGAAGNAVDEPLFGDARWIEERLEALRIPDEAGARRQAD
jgi:hypothetical protein